MQRTKCLPGLAARNLCKILLSLLLRPAVQYYLFGKYCLRSGMYALLPPSLSQRSAEQAEQHTGALFVWQCLFAQRYVRAAAPHRTSCVHTN